MPPFTATSVVVKMNSDGTVIANVGLTDIGQGSTTAFAQIAAERLRFPLSKVRVTIEKDTDRDPYDWQTVASKGLMLTGNALILACADLLDKAYQTAAQALRADVCDLDHDGEKIFIVHRPEISVTFAQLSIGYSYPDGSAIGGPLIGVGRYTAQGLTNLDKGERPGPARPRLDLRRARDHRRGEPDDRRVPYPEDRLRLRRRQGDQSGVGPRAVHRRHGAGPRNGALRRLHL